MTTALSAKESKTVKIGREAHLNVLLLANRNLDAIEEICAAHGITHSQYVALWNLCLVDDADVGVPIGEIADGLLNRASDATRLIDRLERAGLVERLPNPTDRRSVLVRATTKGKKIFRAVTPKVQQYHREQWANLSSRELDALNALLLKALWGDSA